MINKLTNQQTKFLQKVLDLTRHTRTTFSTRASGGGTRIDMVCERILKIGSYDTSNTSHHGDMEKLTYIRNWYIRTQQKK